jgi:selenide,water dikinase
MVRSRRIFRPTPSCGAVHLLPLARAGRYRVGQMNASPAIYPTEKSVVLVGAGNAHLIFVRRWGMRPVPGVEVTLINESSVVPYSAMIPAHIAGEYARDEVTIDLVRLCQSMKVRLVTERVTGIDPGARQVHFADRPALVYDALSLGLGSLPSRPADVPADERSLVLRPLSELLCAIDRLEERLTHSPGPFHLAVVGGGASGCELALALQKRLGKHAGFHVTLLQANEHVLPEFAPGVARIFERAFRERVIDAQVNARVIGVREGEILLDGGRRLAFDAVLWATRASPPPLLRHSGLDCDSNGFLRVTPTLQSVNDPAVFGTGDCVAFEAYPGLPRNGVHAVREGRILFDNVARFLREETLRPYRPQRWCLCLLNTADGRAVLTYGPLSVSGRWARHLKDRIDRAWIEKFTRFAPMTGSGNEKADAYQMRCGGCGSKIPGDVLSAVLKRLDIPEDPRVLLGTRVGEDAAVHRARPELFGASPDKLVEVQTVDYFKSFVDDPYLFGRIAALNAVSDLYAMNARPFSALAIATLAYARGPVQEARLYELLSGAVRSFREVGVVLTGGHTTEGSEAALGFAVTGYAEEDRLFRKSGLRPGDVLILTKPLGTGALLAAWMRGECRADWFGELVASMLRSNGPPSEVFRDAGVIACTDVTGFGLAGHLLEMLDASRVSARLAVKDVPIYPGFEEVVSRGIVSSLHDDNAKTVCRVSGTTQPPAWMFDPQTSGGLLGAVHAEAVDQTLGRLRKAGCVAAAIGEIIPVGDDKLSQIFLQ